MIWSTAAPLRGRERTTAAALGVCGARRAVDAGLSSSGAAAAAAARPPAAARAAFEATLQAPASEVRGRIYQGDEFSNVLMPHFFFLSRRID